MVDICNGGDVRRLDDVIVMVNPRDVGIMSAKTSSAYRNDANIVFLRSLFVPADRLVGFL